MQDLTLEEAVDFLKTRATVITDTEELPLLEADGRVLAGDVTAPFANPPFDRSPLDGYTFAAVGTAGATREKPASFRVVAEECAGAYFDGELKPGEALRLMTGAAIPKGADCVVRQADVKVEGDTLFVPYELHHHENFCFAGEDIEKGTCVLRDGDRLRAAGIAVLASLGMAKVKVRRLQRIVLACTGDELLQPGEPLQPGRIYNSNLYLFGSRLKEMGFDPNIVGSLPDDVNEAAAVLGKLQPEADIIITTGGVSVGKKDIMHGVVPAMGAERLFWRVNMKPGAPVLTYQKGETLGIALSGNPFAAYATFELIVRPILAQMAGRPDLLMKKREAVLTNAFPKTSRGRRLIRAMYDEGEVSVPGQHASGSLYSAVRANALIDIPGGTGALDPGTRVTVWVNQAERSSG